MKVRCTIYVDMTYDGVNAVSGYEIAVGSTGTITASDDNGDGLDGVVTIAINSGSGAEVLDFTISAYQY